VKKHEPFLIPDTNGASYGNVGLGEGRLFLPRLLEADAQRGHLSDEEERRRWEVVRKWAALETSGQLHRRTEKKLQGEFLKDIFGTVLGYRFFADSPAQWDLDTPFSVNGGEADAALGRFAAEGRDPPVAVMELKGPTVNLDRDRFDGRTPVKQCWEYMHAVPCPWGILCNYVSLRLYHRDHTPKVFEHFTLQDLANDRQRFRDFVWVLGHEGLLPLLRDRKSRALDLLDQTDNRQREVGRELYEKYHEYRQRLVGHLRCPPHGKSLDDAIRIAQRLLDRIIFVAFCEDRQLLPRDCLKQAYELKRPFSREPNPRWRNYRDLFESIDKGNSEGDISPYDGGLFEHAPGVDDLDLADAWTAFFHEISLYDFHHEVNVEVLGHLFEQSITDLEAMRAAPPPSGEAAAKSLGKRKREGIYYTPQPITRTIVEQTVGAVLNERFDALARRHRVDPEAEPSEKTLADWLKFQQARLDVLRGLRVCDMACGSGAFLIQAFDFLEDTYLDVVDALNLRKGKDLAVLREQVRGWILSDNLFGVDKSEEAVEITRLALWIRTAEKGKPLTNLSGNIQCGNSLVDDPKVDSGAFDWAARFPRVFAEGGFDCIVSNPPYVKLQNFRRSQPALAPYLAARYRSAKTGNFDLYLPFIERGLELLRPEGRLGFIAPSLWLFNEYGEGLRGLVAEGRTLERVIDFKSHQVFADATTYTALQFFARRRHEAILAADAGDGRLDALIFFPVSYHDLGTGSWPLLESRDQKILEKMRSKGVTLGDATEQIFQGLITSADAVYHLRRIAPGLYWSHALNAEVELEDEIMKPLVSGEDVGPFLARVGEKFLLFPYLVTADERRLLTAKEMAKQYKRAWKYLKRNETLLRGRESGRFDDDQWWRFGRNQSIDKQERPKIAVPRLLLHLRAVADREGRLYLDNVDVGGVLVSAKWNLDYITGILNSRACDFAWRLTSKPFRGEYRSANKQFIAPLPVPKARDPKPVATLAHQLSDLAAQRLEVCRGVYRRFQVDLPPKELVSMSPLLPDLPGKLEAFERLPMGELIEALESFAKRRFKPAERTAWDEFLLPQAQAVAALDRQIADATAELNKRVYALYGLDGDDVKRVEEAAGADDPPRK